jgi:hypothetical protein
MADPINPSKKRVVKKTDIKSSNKKSTSGTETKTVYRKDRVTPKKVVKTEYTNYYTPKGGMMSGSTIESKEKQRFDKTGKLKRTTTLTPIKKVGGSIKRYAAGGVKDGDDPTMKRKCPKGKCGKVSVAPIGSGMQTTGSKIKSGLQKLFTKTHKAGPSRAKRIK